MAVIAAWIALLLMCFGCRAPEQNVWFGTTEPKHGPDELWINNTTEPEFLDPGKGNEGAGGELIWNMFAGLAQYHPSTLQPMPDVSRSWESSDEGRRWIFHLRETRWSDGRPVTAEDFEWSWKRVVDPATDSRSANVLFVLGNAQAFHDRALHVRGLAADSSTAALAKLFDAGIRIDRIERAASGLDGFFVFLGGNAAQLAEQRQAAIAALHGKDGLSVQIADRSVVGVRALDPRTLEVRLATAVPYFLQILPFYTAAPAPRHVIERLERAGQNPDLWTRPENIVTNGAYVLKEWKFRQYMRFEKNPYYWDADRVRTPKVRVAMVESYNTTLNLYRAGELDWIGRNASLPAEFMSHLETFRDFRRSAMLSVYFYWMNTAKPPLDDPKVRRALSLALDRSAIVKYVTRAGQIPTASLVPDGLAGYRALDLPIFDPEAARKLWAETKYAKGEPVPKIVLTYNTSEAHRQIAEAVQQMWKQHLGISVEIENQEWNIFVGNLHMRNFQIARYAWNGDYADPLTFLELLVSTSGNNSSGWSSSEYDRLLSRANSSTNAATRLALMREAESLAFEQPAMIPFYVYTRSQLVKPYLRGFWGNYFDRHPWKYMYVAEQPGEDPPPDPEWFEKN